MRLVESKDSRDLFHDSFMIPKKYILIPKSFRA